MGTGLGRGLGKPLSGATGSALGDNLAPSPLDTLLRAPGAEVIYNADYGWTKSANKVSGLAAQLGNYALAQATGAQQPTYGATSPSGRAGISFSGGAQRLVDPSAALAQLLDGTQQYSALSVSSSPTITGALWSLGNSSTAFELGYENSTTSGVFRLTRGHSGGNASAIGSVTTVAGTIHCMTHTLTTNAALASAWTDGAITINASAALSGKAPVCDTFALGGLFSNGAWTAPFTGTFYFLIISTSIWSTAERQALEAAAKSYFGTP